jgi:hypothetical protein
MSEKQKNLNEWLGLMDDASRADVMKTQIAEDAKTERARIEADARTKDALFSTDGYHFVRAAWALVVALAIGGATCVAVDSHDDVRAKEEREKAAASASASGSAH